MIWLSCLVLLEFNSIQFNWFDPTTRTYACGPPCKSKAKWACWGTTLPTDKRAIGATTPLNHQRIKYTHPQCWWQTPKICTATAQGYNKRGPLHSQNQSSPRVTGPHKVQTGSKSVSHPKHIQAISYQTEGC